MSTTTNNNNKRRASSSSASPSSVSITDAAVPFDVITHHDTGRVVLSFLNAADLGAVASVCRALDVLANDDRLWRELLLAARPHLSSPFVLPGMGSAKRFFRARMEVGDREAPPEPSYASEKERIRGRLSQVFFDIEVLDQNTDQVLFSSIIAFSDEHATKRLLEDGLMVYFPPGLHLQWDDMDEWRPAVHMLDLNGSEFPRRFLAGDTSHGDYQKGDRWGLKYIAAEFSPQGYFGSERVLTGCLLLGDEMGEEDRELISVEMKFQCLVDDSYDDDDICMWRCFEMVLDGLITIN